MSRRSFLVTAGVTAAGLTLGACSSGDSDKGSGGTGTAPTTSASAQPRSGGTLTAPAASSPTHYDQHQLPGIQGDGRVYNQLLRLAAGQQVVKDLATEWETPEPNVYIFKLRQGVTFHNRPPVNGRGFVAEDVVYTIERARQDDPAFTNRWMWTELTSLEAPDDYTLKATFRQPFAPALYHFAAGSMGVVAREVVDAFGDLKEAKSRIGTGPFILEEARRDDITLYRRNPDYFEEGMPYLDELHVPVMPERSTRIVAFRSGQVDMIPWQSGISDVEEPSRGLDDVNVHLRPSDFITAIGFNHAHPALAEERVRKAISLAVNHQDLIRAAGGDDAAVRVGFTHPNGEPFALPLAELQEITKTDVARAKQLMSAAGHEDGFDLALTVSSTDTTGLDVAVVLQQQLAEIGVNVKLDTQETATYVRKLIEKTFDLIFISAWTPALDPGQQFHGSLRSDSAQNWWNANVPEIDRLDDQQVQELDPDKRAELIRELERVNLDKVAALPLFAVNGWVALRSYVMGYDHLRAFNGVGWQDYEVWLNK